MLYIRGPGSSTIFIVYINDVVHAIGKELIYLYANDTVLFVTGNDLYSSGGTTGAIR